ncbi:MAG: acyl-ACP--UDP-N-acetylglucosamine O-acyltransferase [Verrucomicrobia bacterium]|nr:acyl-ACP--UDP-N-acetylglucosamine O-acyltransferase [Verrucomicrobiota bacterium]
MKIHPTALVSPRAEIADDVEIGPYAVIGEEVKLGAGCVVHARVVIEGRTTIGENNSIGCGTVLGAPPQDLAFNGEVRSSLRIGTGNTFLEYVTVHRGTKDGSATVVGDGCRIMGGSHLGHNVVLGNNVVIADNCLFGGYVEVGDGAILGDGSVFHQFLRVGPLSVARSGTRAVKDIPPYVEAYWNNYLSGVNTAGLRKAGWPSAARLEIQRAFDLVYRSHLNVSQALQKARETEWSPAARVFFDFIAASKRGICREPRRESSAA